MKKIVFVMRQLHGGGAERVTAALCNEICRDSEYEVHFVSYPHAQEKDYPLEEKIVRHCMKPTEGRRLKGILDRLHFLRNTIREIEPDCVVSLDGAKMIIVLALAMAGTGIPLILSERNDPAKYPQGKALRFLRDCTYAVCRGVVFQTRGAMAYFPGFIRKKGTVISNPLSDQLPPAFEGSREPRIVNFCRLTKQKNLELLIDAFGDILPEFPDYTLHIYGDGPERQTLEQKILDAELSKNVILHGYQESVYAHIAAASAYVSSSDYEGISNSMLEAIALGIPSICTDCPPGGARETIRDRVNGILVPVGDRAALADAMRRVLSDQTLAASLSREGQLLREELSVSGIARQWLTYIEQTVG